MHKFLNRSTLLMGAVFALGGGLLVVTSDVVAQKGIPVQIGQVPEPGLPPEEGVLVEKLSYPEDRDTSQKFEAVTDYLKAKNPDWAVVAKLAQGLLSAKSDYFYQYNANSPDPKADKRRVSVKDEMNRLIGTFPKDGRDFYELTFGPLAADMLKQAKTDGLDIVKLTDVSQRYFHTKAGGEATSLLANLYLELGSYPEAAYSYSRLLIRPDSDSLLDSRTLFKAVVAFKRAGEGKVPEYAINIWNAIEKKIPRDGVKIGNRLYNLDDLKAEANRPISFLYGKVGEAYVAMKGINATRSGVADADTPFLDPIFVVPVLFHTEQPGERSGAEWVRQEIDKAYNQTRVDKKKVPIPAGFPVTSPNQILFRGYDGAYAFYSKDCVDSSGKAQRAGNLAWFSPAHGGAQTLFTDEDQIARSEKAAAQSAWQGYWANQMPSILFENALLGSISHDGKLAYFIDDLAVLPQPAGFANDPWGGMQPPGANGEGPRTMKDYNKLVAVDLESGMLTWSLGGIGAQLKTDEEDRITISSKLMENSYFLGPPLPLNGKLYTLFERDGHLKLACLDPQKLVMVPGVPGRGPTPAPELVWVQNLGRTNTPLKQDPFRRIQGAFLAASEGVIICPTNTGAIIAVDINARSLLWAHTYSTIIKEDAPLPGGRGRMRPNPNVMNIVQHDRWRSSSPIISNGRVLLTAYDCDQLQCLDLRSGKLLWSEPRKIDDLYVGGISGNKVLIVGKSTVRAVQLTGEKADRKSIPAWKNETQVGTPCGHGVMSKDGVYFLPIIGDPDNKDSVLPAVWAINTETGAIVSKTPFRTKKELGRANVPGSDPRLMLGNLVFHDGLMFSQSATELTAFPLIEVKKREMNMLLAKNPNDPDGLTSRGELLLDEGKLAEAIADLKKAEANKPSDSTTRKIKQKLYIAYTEVLRNKFEDGEKFLAEYKGLCEIPIEENLTAEEKARQLDEQTRRKGLYFSLVAKGRESQGKLVDAFDNYRAFALLGEQKQLVPVPDDANTMARSDVWARGRIEAMIRNAKDADQRKPLEDKIAKEWEGLKNANDLARLRDFVKVFGPFFSTGREAQLLLAEKLLQTGNEEDIRDAQVLLFKLWTSGEDNQAERPVAARAVDLLARAMVRSGMMEDSIGLYGILGSRFGDVVVRDGKTGSEIFGELITDKRYLPYLEPTRNSNFAKYTVEVRDARSGGGNNQPKPNSMTLTPEGEQLPFFKRFRISLSSDQNSGWLTNTLTITDRGTGAKVSGVNAIPGLQTINGYPVLASAYQPLQAAGHLILLHVGQFVSCYDLSQKNLKEPLWRMNLLGTNGVVMNNQQPNAQATSETLPDGDIAVGLANGDPWRFRMGRSSILQAGYACVLTRDGLICMDPKTGTKLWTRANVASKSIIYGDARHIYLIETSSTGSTSRVLRASDGATLEGIKDFGSMATGTQNLETFGRQLLVKEAGEKGRLTIKLYDVIEGKAKWSREFPEGSYAFKSYEPETIAVLNKDGKMEVLASRTGKTLVKGAVPADKLQAHLEEKGKFAATNPILLADAERFYLFLSKPANNQAQVNWWGYQLMKTVAVDGPCYCFDRATGKQLWYTDDQFQDQQILLERFDELPCIVAGNHNNTELPAGRAAVPGQPGILYQVVVLDKKEGRLKHKKGHQQGSIFQWVHYESNGTVEFGHYNLRLQIIPEDAKK